VSGPDTLPGLILNQSGHATGAFRPGLRVQTFVSQGRRLLVANGKRFGLLAIPTSAAQEPVWVPFEVDATVVAVRPR
jgi:hypothetical protein